MDSERITVEPEPSVVVLQRVGIWLADCLTLSLRLVVICAFYELHVSRSTAHAHRTSKPRFKHVDERNKSASSSVHSHASLNLKPDS